MFCVPRRPIYSIISSDNPLEKIYLQTMDCLLWAPSHRYMYLWPLIFLLYLNWIEVCLPEFSFSFWVVKYQRADPRDEGYGYWNNEKKFHAGAGNFTHTTEEVVVYNQWSVPKFTSSQKHRWPLELILHSIINGFNAKNVSQERTDTKILPR